MDRTTVDQNVGPLQAGDPRRLGPYELIGWLGGAVKERFSWGRPSRVGGSPSSYCTRPGLSRTVVSAGLTSAMMLVAALVLVFAWPDDGGRFTRSTSPLSTSQTPAGNEEQSARNGVPQGTPRSQPSTQRTKSSGTSESSGAGTGTTGDGGTNTDHGNPHTPPPTHWPPPDADRHPHRDHVRQHDH